MQYPSLSVQDNSVLYNNPAALHREREPLPDDVVSQVSYCATNNSAIPPTSPKEIDRQQQASPRS